MSSHERQGRDAVPPSRAALLQGMPAGRNVFLNHGSEQQKRLVLVAPVDNADVAQRRRIVLWHSRPTAVQDIPFVETPPTRIPSGVSHIIRDLIRDCGGMTGHPMYTIAERARCYFYHDWRPKYVLINKRTCYLDNDRLLLAFETPRGEQDYHLTRPVIKVICNEPPSKKPMKEYPH